MGGAAVLVVQIVGVLPHVEGEEGLAFKVSAGDKFVKVKHISVSFENVAGVNLVGNVVQGRIVAVGDDGIGLGLEGGKVIDDT